MAEPQKGSSSAVNLKEKNSLLGDVDFGKDFFTSWDSTNVSGDDAMDFNFGSVAKGKKKAFSFDKLDVDFSFDGDLDKMSSFKVDMSDIDISSPLKTSGTKVNSKAESGANQKKQDRFNFSFDFNELDSFQFEPSLTKEGNKAGKNKDIEEASKKRECQGSGTEQRDISSASDSLKSNLSASEGMAISKSKPTVGELGKFDFTDHSSSLVIKDGTSNLPPNQNCAEPVEATMPEMTSDSLPQEMVQDAMCQEETAYPSSLKESTQDFSAQSVSGDQATQVRHSEIQAEVSSRATNDTIREQISNRASVASLEPEGSLFETQENSMTKLCSDDSERRINADNVSVSNGNKDGFEPAQCAADSAGTSSSTTSRKSICATESSIEHQNGNLKGRVSSPNSETSKSVETKENEISSVRSKYFKRLDGRESQFRQRQSSQTALAMFPSKLIGSNQQTDELRDVAVPTNAQDGNKVVRISDSVCQEITRTDGEPESVKTVKGLKDIGESLNADSLLSGSKSAGFSRLGEKEIRIREPTRVPEMHTTGLVTLSSALKSPTPIEQISKPTTQHATSRTVLSTVSIKSLHNSSGKGNKTSTPKEIRSLTDLSGLKISRALGESHCPSNAAVQKQTNSSTKLMQIREVEESAPSNVSPSISTEKQSRLSPSLKRKTYEASSADTPIIKPLKRFSPSPTGIRNAKELLEEAKKEVRNNENVAKRHNSGGFQSPTLEIAREMNLSDLKMPLVIETDDNVEKAEAYAKDLEDMCNMLKKKHEEAKELLVRAVVNNNNLLMLNHPIYEEKIRKIQNFAGQLMSKEVHA